MEAGDEDRQQRGDSQQSPATPIITTTTLQLSLYHRLFIHTTEASTTEPILCSSARSSLQPHCPQKDCEGAFVSLNSLWSSALVVLSSFSLSPRSEVGCSLFPFLFLSFFCRRDDDLRSVVHQHEG